MQAQEDQHPYRTAASFGRWSLILIVAATLAACRVQPQIAPMQFVSSQPSPDVETREVQLADDLITLRLHIPRGGEPKKPTIISMIGGNPGFLDRKWLVATYRVNWEFCKLPLPVEIDPGAVTVGTWVLASASPARMGERYLRTIALTGNVVIPKIIDYLQTVPEVDPRHIAIAGSSTNGMIALQAVSRERRLAAAVSLAGCGDYQRFIQYSSMGMRGDPLALDPDYQRWLSRQEPIRRPRRWLRTAVLMVNRRGDAIIPIECADATAAVAAPVYRRAGRGDRFRYSVIEGMEHGVAQLELDAMLAWLDRWLDPHPPYPRTHTTDAPTH